MSRRKEPDEIFTRYIDILHGEDRGLALHDKELALEKARPLFIDFHVPISILCKWFGFARTDSAVIRQVAEWTLEKQEIARAKWEIIKSKRESFKHADLGAVTSLKNLSLDIMVRELEAIHEQGIELSMKDLDVISKIYEKVEKALALKLGEATSITATRSMDDEVSMEDLNRALEEMSETDSKTLGDGQTH